MKLYLIRHGTTSWNAARKIQGRTDIPLDQAGEEIARATGEKLKELGISFRYVFSSPLQRAYRTAELAAPGNAIQTDPRLRELSFGAFEGHSVEAMRNDPGCPFRYFRDQPDLYEKAVKEYEKNRPEDHFESLSSLSLRSGDFLREIIDPLALSEAGETNVLISGHGALNSALMMNILERKDFSEFWGKGLQANCGIFIIEALPLSSGRISYSTDETCRIFYDPGLLSKVPSLL